MTIFLPGYRFIPGLSDTALAKCHFWMNEIGALVLLTALFLLMIGRVAEASIGMVFPVAQLAVWIGVLCWAANLFRTAH